MLLVLCIAVQQHDDALAATDLRLEEQNFVLQPGAISRLQGQWPRNDGGLQDVPACWLASMVLDRCCVVVLQVRTQGKAALSVRGSYCFRIVHHSSFISHHSSVIMHHPSFIIHHPSFISHHSSSVIYQSSFVGHHSSFINHHPSSINHHPSVIIRQSSFSSITHHSSFIIHQP